MYQYFIKIVPTIYSSLNGRLLNTNQFSVTEYFKPLQNDGHGLPGMFSILFFVYFFHVKSHNKIITLFALVKE